MKKIYSILMILAATAGFTNCSKADLVENKETGNGGAVVYATTDAATKTTLDDDYKVLWSTGDQIKFVKNDATATTHTFTLSSGNGTTSGTFTCNETPADGTYTVYYPATYNDTNWPAQTYVDATDISGAPMKATATVSGGSVSDISFKNEGGILRYTVKGDETIKIKSINVTSASPALNVTLDCGGGVALAAEGTVFNIALPAGEYSNATLRFIATDNTVATKTASSFIVTKNKVSLATFDGLTYLPAGALPGEFSVSNDGGTTIEQVHFSQGNLWYGKVGSATTATFNFEANQYDTTPASDGFWSSDHISHFYWSKSVDEAVKEEYNLKQDRDENDVFFTNETETTSKNDFTVNVGGTEQTGWRTLSTKEWQYLFNTRTDASNKYGYATVGGVNGIIILPDSFTDPMKNNGSDAFVPKSSTGWTQNVYTSGDNWNAMETAGAVFLPAAGDRLGFLVGRLGSVGDYGYYWSSSAAGSDLAYIVLFNSSDVSPGTNGSRSLGLSVRLITESK